MNRSGQEQILSKEGQGVALSSRFSLPLSSFSLFLVYLYGTFCTRATNIHHCCSSFRFSSLFSSSFPSLFFVLAANPGSFGGLFEEKTFEPNKDEKQPRLSKNFRIFILNHRNVFSGECQLFTLIMNMF